MRTVKQIKKVDIQAKVLARLGCPAFLWMLILEEIQGKFT